MEYILNPENVNGKGNCPNHCPDENILLYGVITPPPCHGKV